MEPTDLPPSPDSPARRRGLAIFGVLILVVAFSLLGVVGLKLSQMESLSSGSVLDIKSRQSAAYAGMVFALSELQRDPANFAAQLESWRTKSVYGVASKPLPQLYLRFDAAGGPVAFTPTKPAPFALAGTSNKILVELAGIQVPTSPTEGPVIALRATGTGRSGDAQTVLGAYRIRNIRLGSGTGATLDITHPFYVAVGGDWNNSLVTDGGDVYLGGNIRLNSAASKLEIKNGGLRVNGDFWWNASVTVSVQGKSWIEGDMTIQSGSSTTNRSFQDHLVVGGFLQWLDNSKLDVEGALVVKGAGGIVDLHGGSLDVGSAGNAKSQLYLPRGPIATSNSGSVVNVINGSAYLHQLDIGATKTATLNVAKRLELSDNASLAQNFHGKGAWGQLVVRSLASGSEIADDGTGSITIKGASWAETAGNLKLGVAGWPFGRPINFTAGAYLYHTTAAVPGTWSLTAPWPSTNPDRPNTVPPPAAGIRRLAQGLTPEGFDGGTPPYEETALGMGTAPNSDKEIGVDLAQDPQVAAKALNAEAGGALCEDAFSLCGASLNRQRDDDIAAGSTHFHRGYFVLKIDKLGLWPAKFSYDAGGATTSPLRGKWLILVVSNLASGAAPWPTTAANADPLHPANIQFVLVPAGSDGSIFPSFQPRTSKDPLAAPVDFCGYVRDDARNSSTWNPSAGVTIRGAMHVMGPPTGSFTTNSGTSNLATFRLDKPVLDDIGMAFGSIFKDAVTGAPLGSGSTGGFLAIENWIQFDPIAELR